jgi:AraC family transcriptional regulator, regulatory protein of adaptative response / DNA-3-methyladenine glycosylase II
MSYKRGMRLDSEACYRAFASRDRRFEGRFVTAVVTTGIYCRPGCPARLPRRQNVRFYACSAAAEEAGFRPCFRCRPDSTPGTPAWIGTSATVNRALRLIEEGGLDDVSVEALAERVGVTARHLRRLFTEHLGAAPLTLARSRRVHFARRLMDETALPLHQIALSAGFSNVRRFNQAMRETYHCAPRELRRAGRGAEAPPDGRSPTSGADADKTVRRKSAASARKPRPAPAAIELTLRARKPFDGAAVLAFLAARAVPGLESVDRGVYVRAVDWSGARGTVAVRPNAEGLDVEVRLPAHRDLIRVATRLERMFDLNADSAFILAHLRRDPLLRAALAGRRDLRVPGAWDPFELAVRAILGQQVSVRGAATIAGRLVLAAGEPLGSPDGRVTHAFPTPERVAAADLSRIGLPKARAAALQSLAREVASGSLRFDQLGGLEAAVERLTALPGIGEWTAQYIAMRALGEPDAFPAGDLGIAHALARGTARPNVERARERAESWRPWRAYAVMALWTRPAKPNLGARPAKPTRKTRPAKPKRRTS